jgi:hypothetical protein
MIAAHGFKAAFLITVQPVQEVLLPAPVIETTCAIPFFVINKKEKRKIIKNL